MIETSTTPAVHGESVGFELDVERGVFHLVSSRTGRPIATNLECQIQMADRTLRSTTGRAIWRPLSEDKGNGLDILFGVEGEMRLGLQVRLHEITGGITLRMSFTNPESTSFLMEGVVLTTGEAGRLDFCPNYSQLRFFQNGWLSWDSAGTVQAGSRATEQREGISIESSLVAGLTSGAENEGLILGFEEAIRQTSQIRLEQSGETAALSAVVDAHSVELPPGDTFTSETLWIGFGTMPSLRLLDYARSKPQGRVADRFPVIWDCWYPRFEAMTEKEILSTLDTLRDKLPDVDTVMVSDGYQLIHHGGPGIGDWLESNSNFPHGLAWLAGQIRKRGFRPGIWTAPFLVGESSQLYKYYASGIVRSRESNQPHWREMWRGDRAYYLDTTHPDARHFVRDIFETLCFRDGFEVFQVDFAYAAAADGFRFDRSATGAQALDMGLEIIRKTIGERRYLLLSGAPIGAGTNYVDAIRSTRDAGPGWQGSCGALSVVQGILTRSFQGDSFPAMAPAPILVGGDNLSEDEFKVLITAVGLSGGPASFSGDLSSLSPARQSMLRQLIPAYTRPAVPIDLFDRSVPQLFGLPVHSPREPWWVVAVFNTSDSPASRRVDFKRLGWASRAIHVYEAWSHEYLGLTENGITLSDLPPHSCKLLALHVDTGQPQVISAGDHIVQGAASVRRTEWHPSEGGKAGRLVVDLARPGRTEMSVHLVVPEGLLARSVHGRNGNVQLNRKKSSGRLLSVEAAFRDHCSFDLNF